MLYLQQKLLFTALIFIAVILTSCSSYVPISNNSFADRQIIPSGFPRGSSFYIEVPTEGENKLFAKEVAYKIAVLVGNKGYVIESDQKNADYTLAFSMSISPQTKKVLVSKYVPGIVKTRRNKVLTSEGTWSDDRIEEISTSGSYIDVEEERLTFKKDFSVQVFDNKQGEGAEEEVWQASIGSNNSRSDLRAEIDYLLVAAFNYFGKNTQKRISTAIASKSVKSLRKQYF